MMEPREPDSVVAFDTLYTNNRIQIMKVMLPYLEPAMQKKMAIHIKLMELQYTITFFNKKEGEINICSKETKATDTSALLMNMQRYCSKEQRDKINQFVNMQNTFKMYQEMQGMMEMFGMFSGNDSGDGDGVPYNGDGEEGGTGFGSGFNNGFNSGFDMTEMLKNMLSPEQQAMFDMFNQDMQPVP